MSFIFYSAPMSTATVTELALEELGVPHEKIVLDTKAGDTKKPAYLKLNPNGKVPCIVHDGTPIWESSAIAIYLGETFGTAKGLWPAPGPKRGQAMMWVAWTNVTLGEAVYRRGQAGDWAPPELQNPKVVEKATADIGELLGILDAALAGKQFLVGEYTLADAHLNSFCDWLRHMKLDFSKAPNVNAWSARCAERPAYKKVIAAAMG